MAEDVLNFADFCLRLNEVTGVAVEEMTPETRLIEDLALDSFGLLELLIIMEDTAGVEFPDDLLPQIRTLGDAHSFYETKAGHPQSGRLG